MNKDIDSSYPLKKNLGGISLVIIVAALVMIWMSLQKQDSFDGQSLSPGSEGNYSDLDLVKFNKDALYLPNNYLLGFVKIPSGRFLMGSDPDVDVMAYGNERWSANKKQAEFYLDEYYISQYEVTVAQYNEFIKATGYSVKDEVVNQPGDHPVTNVSWTDALAYCRWLEEALRNNVHFPADIREMLNANWHFSLPNEAQWEKAARGLRGNIYPWGNDLDADRVNFNTDGAEAVGSRSCPDCAFGLSDMSGNVWELTRSPFVQYPFTLKTNLSDLSKPALWIMRGGSYSDRENNIRAAVRGGVAPGERRPNIGFRIVLSDLKN